MEQPESDTQSGGDRTPQRRAVGRPIYHDGVWFADKARERYDHYVRAFPGDLLGECRSERGKLGSIIEPHHVERAYENIVARPRARELGKTLASVALGATASPLGVMLYRAQEAGVRPEDAGVLAFLMAATVLSLGLLIWFHK